jgi:hypothetical protein
MILQVILTRTYRLCNNGLNKRMRIGAPMQLAHAPRHGVQKVQMHPSPFRIEKSYIKYIKN